MRSAAYRRAARVRAGVEVRGGWPGSFVLIAGDPRVRVSCSAQPDPQVGIDEAALNYMETSHVASPGNPVRLTHPGSPVFVR